MESPPTAPKKMLEAMRAVKVGTRPKDRPLMAVDHEGNVLGKAYVGVDAVAGDDGDRMVMGK